jgi:hypothetical protein
LFPVNEAGGERWTAFSTVAMKIKIFNKINWLHL